MQFVFLTILIFIFHFLNHYGPENKQKKKHSHFQIFLLQQMAFSKYNQWFLLFFKNKEPKIENKWEKNNKSIKMH